ncbi:GNAT family N-acetyltransferase [Actinorhabdospora filicis]|nr:GNAT family N-acetyltransferase [Actinorhabdospora filicis]
MSIVLSTPTVTELDAAVAALREWQYEGAPMQLHPGDLGWFGKTGAEVTAAAVRTWSRDGRIIALALLDMPVLLRMTMAPDVRQDEELAARLVADFGDPERGVLPAEEVWVEAPIDALLQTRLAEAGWHEDEKWTPLRRDLTDPVEDPGLRIEVVGPELAEVRAAVQRSAFGSTMMTAELWHTMAASKAYADARCLIAYDGDDAVAMVTVWSAGPGKPGLLEPMGVHADHRGRGHARAITRAAAAALREMGASSALVGAQSSNVGAVAAYQSGGFEARPEIRDMRRDAL